MRIPSGTVDQYLYFVGVDATDFTTRETGLTGFTVYRSRNGGASAAMTTPTINETDATNMPGVYELLADEDMTIDSGNDSEEMAFHITAPGMAPVTRTIELYRPKITQGNTLGVESDGDLTKVNTCETNTDMRGTDNALLAASAPTNFGDLSITATTGLVSVGTNNDKTGYSISGTKTTLDALNDVAATDIVTGGAITTAAGAVSSVGVVDTCTSNTDMRGTDNALLAASAPTNFSALSITATGVVDGDVVAWQGFTIPGLSMIENDAGNGRFTAQALEQAPSGGGGTSDWTAAEREQIRDSLGVDGAKTAATGGQLQTIDTNVDAILVDTGTDIPAQISGLNDVAATDIVTGGPIATTAGAVDNVTLVDATTANTDMRGTDGANTVTPPTAIENADALLDRDMAAGPDTEARSVRSALRASRNRVDTTVNPARVYKEDDTTVSHTVNITRDATADNIVGTDPV